MTTPSCLSQGCLLLIGLVLSVGSGSRADDWFMKIDDELEWTPIKTAGVLACRPLDPNNQGNGPATFSFEIRKALDRTSPVLLQKCGLGQPLNRVTLAYILAQPQATQYRFTLSNVLVSSFDQSGSANSQSSREREVVHFTFEKIEMAWLDLAPSGGTAGGLTAWLDQATGETGLKPRPPFLVTLSHPRGSPGVLVSWPAEAGHRYQILTRGTPTAPWTRLAESTAPADGPMSQVLPNEVPSLFLRVEEID